MKKMSKKKGQITSSLKVSNNNAVANTAGVAAPPAGQQR